MVFSIGNWLRPSGRVPVRKLLSTSMNTNSCASTTDAGNGPLRSFVAKSSVCNMERLNSDVGMVPASLRMFRITAIICKYPSTEGAEVQIKPCHLSTQGLVVAFKKSQGTPVESALSQRQ